MLRTLVKDSAIYAVGTIASRLVGFIMIPVYTRVLTPADYGVIEAVGRITEVLGILLALGLAESLLRHYYMAKSEDERRRLISTTFTLNLTVVIVGSLLVLPVSPLLARLVFGHERYLHYVNLAVIGLLVGTLIELPLTLWRAEGKAWLYTSISLVKLAGQLATNIMLVVWLRWGVYGVFLSGLVNAVAWSAILGFAVRRRYGLALDSQWLKPVLTYALPIIPMWLAQFTLHASDRFFLTRFVSEAELGLYALAYRFGFLVSTFSGIVELAWRPLSFSMADTEDADRHLRRGTTFILLMAAWLTVATATLSPPVIRLLSAPPFWEAADYVPWIAVAYWFFVAQNPLSTGARLARRTDLLAGANVATAVMCLALSFVLIPRYGAWGAVMVTVISMAVLAILSVVVSQHCRHIEYDGTSIALCFLLLGLSLLPSYVRVSNSVVDAFFRGSYVAVVGAGITVWIYRRVAKHAGGICVFRRPT